jgi:hypothetical protein
MNAFGYEWRRLTSIRSTGLILLAVLVLDAAVAGLTVRQAALAEPARVLTAGIPLLPLPLAALGAGAVGALAYGHEVRYPLLSPLLLPLRRRLGLLLAKLVLVGAFSALLALATLAADAVVLQSAEDPGGVESALSHGALQAALVGFVALVVAGGWIGLLAAGLLRSAAAGMLVLVVLPVLAEPAVTVLRSRADLLGGDGQLGLARWRRLFPVDAHHAWIYGPLSGLRSSAPLSSVELAALVAVPVLVLLAGYVLLLARRRGI